MTRVMKLVAAGTALFGVLVLAGCDTGANKGSTPPKSQSAPPSGGPGQAPAPPPIGK